MLKAIEGLCFAAALVLGSQALGQTATAPADPFGQEVTLTEKTVVMLSGNGRWESAFETLVEAFKTVRGYLTREGIKPAGEAMMIYVAADDLGFRFQAAIPVAETPKKQPTGDLSVGKSPAGKAYKFVHRGSYDAMNDTYEAITNFLDEKNLDAKDLFIEEYVTDPATTPEDRLVINIYVPTR
jgi:effector-binding domain-containing protein